MSSFRSPEYLSDDDHPIHRVRCPIHGFIHFSCHERSVIDHWIFRRLRFIKQLALTDLLYPSASHTRFEHSLGVMHVATMVFDRLCRSHGGHLETVFKKIPALEDKPLAKVRQILRLAALLHDVGHAPFSHAAESVIHEGTGHEELTITVLEEKDLLGKLVDSTFFPDCAELTASIIGGGAKLQPQLQILRDIVTGQMDADRTDYLLRDSHHCGVEYGRFDHLRMIESLTIAEGPGDSLEIAIDRGGIHTFEALILARYQMNTQVYYHKIRRIYDLYLKEFFRSKGRGEFDTPEKILRQNDVTLMTQILKDSILKGPEESVWAYRIAFRQHHRCVHETGEMTAATDVRDSNEVFEELKCRFGDKDFIWDKAEAKIHNLRRRDDQDDRDYEDLWMIDSNGKRRQIGEESHILRHMPRRFQIARIFCDTSELSREVVTEITKFADDRYREKGGR